SRPALSGKHASVRGARRILSLLEDLSRTLSQFLSRGKLLLTRKKLRAPQIDNADPHLVAFPDEHLTRRKQRFLGFLILQRFEVCDALVGQTLPGFVSISQPMECLVRAGSDLRGIIEEIQLEINLGAVHVTETDAACIAQFLVPAPHLFENSQGRRIIASAEMHLGNSAIGKRRPESESVTFAMFLGYFEGLHRFIEAIHLGQDIRAVETDRGQRYIRESVVGVLKKFLRAIVMTEGFAIPIETVVHIAERDLQRGEILNVLR